MIEQPLFVVYRNWQGETAVREIYPKSVYYGVTQWHTEPQWFLLARDESKGATRDFAMADILSTHHSYDDAESALRPAQDDSMISINDQFAMNNQPVRLRVDRIIPGRPRTEATAFMPALPTMDESYEVIELTGPTPGSIWIASRTFFRTHCTRVIDHVT